MASPAVSVFAELGALTSDDIPLSQLYTEIYDEIVNYNQVAVNFYTLLCQPTTKHSVRVDQRGMEFEELGGDTQTPAMQHIPYVDFDLPKPRKFGLATAVTAEELDEGIDSVTVLTRGAQAVEGDKRLVQKWVMREALQMGSWWDATETVAPPPYGINVFDTNHSHFLFRDADGIPDVNDIADMLQHLVHHGYTEDITCWMNSWTVTNLVKVAKIEPQTNLFLSPTPIVAQLQEAGYRPAMEMAGVSIYRNEWIPPGYIFMFSAANEKPFQWRNPEGRARDGGIQVWAHTPNAQYGAFEQYVRYCSVKAVYRGKGVACYLGSASEWVDPVIPVGYTEVAEANA